MLREDAPKTRWFLSSSRLPARPDPRSSIERFVDSLYSLLVWPFGSPSSGEESAFLAHAMSDDRFSKSELKVRAIARRRANLQLLRVPWSRFQKAYEEYPRWQALALWIEAIIAARDSVPSWLKDDLRKHCPSFVEHEANSNEPKAMGLHLLEWAHNHKFGYAKQQGWLDALTFYGVRHPSSECAWKYWEQCERDWIENKSETFPSFDVWWRNAKKMKLCDKLSYRDLGRAIEKYLDWEALSLWLRPLLASDVKLPKHVISELKRKCPGILAAQGGGTPRPNVENSEIWRNLLKWGRNHCRLQAGKQGHLDLRQRAQSHPLHARLLFYAKHWARQQSRTSAQSYPSFRAWQQNAQGN